MELIISLREILKGSAKIKVIITFGWLYVQVRRDDFGDFKEVR